MSLIASLNSIEMINMKHLLNVVNLTKQIHVPQDLTIHLNNIQNENVRF